MNIIFDLGNILIEWNQEKILLNIVGKEDFSAFHETIFQSGLWEKVDSGEMSMEELENHAISALGMEQADKIREIIWEWPKYVDVFPEIYDLISQLKERGHSIYILSNTNTIFYRILDEQLLSLRPHIDGFIISCEVKRMKPDYEIYELLLEKYHLDRSQSIFFDDMAENVRAAKEVGLTAYHIQNKEELQTILRDLL